MSRMVIWLLGATFLLAFATPAWAVPLKLEYAVSGTGPYTYNFKLTLDNNDSTWTSTSQGWGWLIFGDSATSSPLTGWTTTSAYPVGPWTSTSSSGGGHNGPTFAYVLDRWIPTQLYESLSWTGTSTANLAQGQLLWSTLSNVGGAVGANFTVANRVDPVLQVSSTAGTTQVVPPTDTGPTGTGRSIGTFTITNASATTAVTLNAISITASGTGIDNTGYSEVGLFDDSTGTTAGVWDAGDTRYGTALTAYAVDNGIRTFSGNVSFAASQTRRYFVVVKLNGSTLPFNAHTFNTRVSGLAVTGGSCSGLPSTIMNGLTVTAPQITVAATAGTAQTVPPTDTGPTGTGRSVGTFTLTNNAVGASTLNSITLTASGTGIDNTAYSEVGIFEDTNPNSVWDASDTRYGSALTAYSADNGTAIFNGVTAFAASQQRRYFVVVKLNGSTLAFNSHTFNCQVSAVIAAVGSSGAGTPSATMNGLVVTAPQITVSATAGTAQTVPNTDTGPSGNGRSIGTFTLTNNAVGASTLNSITLTASGSGNDSNAYSEVGLFDDSTGTTAGVWDAGDTRYGTAATAFPSDNGSLTFSGSVSFAVSQQRRYFVVVKRNGSTLAANGETFNTQVTAVTAAVGSSGAGTPSTVMNGLIAQTPVITVAATAGTAQSVQATDTGPSGTGRSIGTFSLSNNAAGAATLNSITLAALGNGNDSNAYSEVGIFEDSTGTTAGVWDAADTRYGTAAVAYPIDNGTLTFTASMSFAASQSRTFFVVVKLNGATLASPGQAFNTQVSSITVASGASTAGTPSATMNGLVIVQPVLTVSASAGTAQSVYANHTGSGGNGVSIGTFTITNNAVGSATLNSITLTASGNGDDSSAYSEVGIFEDSNGTTAGVWDAADSRYGTAATAYPIDNGSLTFTASLSFAASQTRTFFVVVKLNGATPAAPGQAFNTQVNAITVASGSGTSGTPSTTMNGLTILAPSFTFTDNSSATQGTAYLGGTGYVIQQFTIAYPNGPANTLTSITVQSSGSGNDQNDYASVALYRDANANTTYDVGVDVQVHSFTAFPINNGSQSFTLSGTESQFTAGTTRQYYIVVAFNLNGSNNTDFASQIQAASGASTGTTFSGLPAPTATATAGLLLLANNLLVTVNGPGTATTVNNNSQGPGGLGHVILDFTLQTINAAWTVTDLTFQGNGGANHQTAYNYLALFEDSNSSTTFDGADSLASAAPGVTFGAGDQYTATLSNSAISATSSRRFFLVGKLAGTATTGQTLNALIAAATTTPPSGGLVTTIPTSASTALIIDSAVVTAINGTAAPAGATREGGAAFSHTLGFFSFTASNNTATLNSITLTTSGSGDWTTDVATVQLYLDNGNGVYDAGVDSLVFTGAGATPTLGCTLASAVNIANNQTQSLWVRVNFVATAGASVPETFIASIAAASDVNVTGATALLGTPAPTTNAVSVVVFFVTTFAPAFDLQTGGAAITITGSGFLSPVTLTIGGAVCPGTAVIGAGGTQITGFTVPPGSGTNKVIVLTNGALGPKTLTQTFDYAGGSTIGTGGGGGGGGGGGCEATESNAAWLAALALLAFAGTLALRRRAA